MTPYTHGGDVLTARARFGGDVLDCSANLNPLGMPPAVQAAAAAAAADSARYPDPLCRALRAAIAAHDGVADRCLRRRAAELISGWPTPCVPGGRWSLPGLRVEEALTAAGCAVTRHPAPGEPLTRRRAGRHRAVEPVFPHPNNPTGRLVDGRCCGGGEQCRAVGAVLAVDECFLPLSDGAGPGLAPCLAEHPNLLLLRAFTKSYAMAGLRLGYALSANGGLLERMAAAGPPWSVSTPAQAAGLAALEQCPDWPEKARTLLASERPALSDGLTALGLEVVPGQVNYLLFRAAGAADLKERMLMRGVLIRSCANYHGLGNDWYRVCVGQAEQNRRLLAALKEVL
ncbi:MAG: pyridoxal phosphate-dependent aminotransferase [Flavonifractor plautii]